ncbi:MAG: MFS transporter, partial [Alphaproteobacteria bacterium]|nr:MFS transporter [Alphaproteobacteria bacterium]
IKKINNMYHSIKSKITIHTFLTDSKATIFQSVLKNLEHQHTFSIPLHPIYLSNVFYSRLPLFCFFMAEYMLGAFLPVYSQSLYTPFLGMPQGIVITLPIVSFMFTYALSQLLSGLMTQFVKRRYIFIYGGLIYAIGTLGSAFTYNLIDFVVWRLFSGFGYGLFLMAWQAYFADYNNAPSHSFQNTVIYMGGFYAATVCGTATGSLLVDVFGFRGTVFVSSLLGMAATFIAHSHSKILKKALFPQKNSKNIEKEQNPLTFRECLSVFLRFISFRKNPYILGFLMCVAIPSRLLMAGIFWHGLPLHLSSLHYSMPKIGGIMMLFGLGFYGISFVIPRYATTVTNPLKLTLIGATIALLSVLFVCGTKEPTLFYMLFTLIMGFGSGLSLTAQISIPGSLYYKSKTSSPVEVMTMRFYRFFELSGLFLGPLLMGIMMFFMPIKTAIIILAGANIMLTLSYYIIVTLKIIVNDRRKAIP